MNKLSVLELFAGIGGIRLGFDFAGGFDFTRAIEISATARLVYAHRFPDTPIWDDVQTFNGKPGEFDCIIGGSPCQDLSACGNKAGLDGERSGLWWQQLRIIDEIKPKFVGWENVEGALSRGCREVVASLRMVGYEVEGPVVVSAAELGAPHLRKRIFIVAHRNDLSLWERDGFTGWEEQLGNQIAIARKYSYAQSQRRDTGVQQRENWGNKSDGIPETSDSSECEQCDIARVSEEQSVGNARSTRLQRSLADEKDGDGSGIGRQFSAVDTTRSISKPAGVGVDDGISTELGGIGADAPAWLAGIRRSGWWLDNLPPDHAGIDGKRIKGRRECINHYGAACTPLQAVPMALRIKYLASL
ncbi:MAG: DNA cytosine methyltransferase [Oscillatoriales cyanobacterium]|nr:MAG: DNA cytosine methyltransferase [Oscillatoriales cyanobacterium]